ncbi:acyl-CoA N-acyltransferase [Geranomyces variabilis]|nr:acyl-CoA N-acyltransferase [Geranomyces variabilis]KAJ3133084.1 hypothetical protein HDU90_006426 [Geranomyces variabilis]
MASAPGRIENGFYIAAATPSDVPTMARLSAASFSTDRNTLVKGLGKEGYSLEQVMTEAIPSWMKSKNCVVLKAVSETSGDIAGWCTWGFRGLEESEVLTIGEAMYRSPSDPAAATTPPVNEAEEVERREDARAGDTINDSTEPDAPINNDMVVADKAAALEALTSADMARWMSILMPDGCRCMFVVSLIVAPHWQKRGVGRALVRWATDQADKLGLYAWVHASDPSWGMYQKCGFETVGRLDIDLDSYAIAPPKEGQGVEDGKWGQYVFRYMKRMPRNVSIASST